MSWPLVKLSDFSECLKSHYGEDVGVHEVELPVVKVANVDAEGYFHREFEIRSFQHTKVDELAVSEGDLLVVKSSGSKANVLSGKTALCRKEHEGKLVCSNFLMRVRLDKDKADPEYVWRYLNSRYSKAFIQTVVGATTYPNLKWSTYKDHPIPLPPLPIQKQIAAVLEKADTLRSQCRQMEQELNQLAQSVFLEMFGEPVTNPKGWETKHFSDLGELNRGKSKHRPRNDPALLGGPYPLIQTGDVARADNYITSFSQTYSELGLKQSRMWPRGTLCITIAANIADTAILDFDACFPDSVVGFLSDDEKTSNVFVHYWLKFYQTILEQTAPESAQKNINLKILESLDIFVPPKELQDEFVEFLNRIEKQKSVAREKTKLADNYFSAIMQSAFTGKLNLPQAA